MDGAWEANRPVRKAFGNVDRLHRILLWKAGGTVKSDAESVKVPSVLQRWTDQIPLLTGEEWQRKANILKEFKANRTRELIKGGVSHRRLYGGETCANTNCYYIDNNNLIASIDEDCGTSFANYMEFYSGVVDHCYNKAIWPGASESFGCWVTKADITVENGCTPAEYCDRCFTLTHLPATHISVCCCA